MVLGMSVGEFELGGLGTVVEEELLLEVAKAAVELLEVLGRWVAIYGGGR